MLVCQSWVGKSVDADSLIEAGFADLMMCLVKAGQYYRSVECPFDEGRSFQRISHDGRTLFLLLARVSAQCYHGLSTYETSSVLKGPTMNVFKENAWIQMFQKEKCTVGT